MRNRVVIDTNVMVSFLIGKRLRKLKDKLSEAVKQLPPQQQKIYTLYKEQGIKQDEIAKQLNLSRSTIQSHMKLAMGNIHKYLSLYYSELLIIAVLMFF